MAVASYTNLEMTATCLRCALRSECPCIGNFKLKGFTESCCRNRSCEPRVTRHPWGPHPPVSTNIQNFPCALLSYAWQRHRSSADKHRAATTRLDDFGQRSGDSLETRRWLTLCTRILGTRGQSQASRGSTR